jgi:protein farnesyltransferase subunit beta
LDCWESEPQLTTRVSRYPDAYHTCYNLAGLSATQHRYVYDYSKSSGPEAAPLSAAFNWTVADVVGEEGKVWDDGDEVKTIHPVFAVPWGQAEAARKHFEGKDGF